MFSIKESNSLQKPKLTKLKTQTLSAQACAFKFNSSSVHPQHGTVRGMGLGWIMLTIYSTLGKLQGKLAQRAWDKEELGSEQTF